MPFFVNQTQPYHKNDMDDLKWEVTVCNSMEHSTSPVRQILAANRSYGEHLADYLFDCIPKERCRNIMEVGGGYGFLMRDLLGHSPGSRTDAGSEAQSSIRATMVDISPAMISRQRQTLKNFPVRFLQSDFFDIDHDLIRDQDLVIMNEILGDLPTACHMTSDMITCENHDDKFFKKIRQYITGGIIELPADEPFNLNIGAMIALEKLCSCNVPNIFLSEHSCEAAVNDYMSRYIKREPAGNPEEIRLIGHSEYTIRFSHLERIARAFGYAVVRGNYTDFIKVSFSNRIHRIFKSSSQKDEHEIIRHFIEDLYIYEYMLLIKKP